MREEVGRRTEREVRDDPVGLGRKAQAAPVEAQDAHPVEQAGTPERRGEVVGHQVIALHREDERARPGERECERAATGAELDDQLVGRERQPPEELRDDPPVDEEVLPVTTPALVSRTARPCPRPGHGGDAP